LRFLDDFSPLVRVPLIMVPDSTDQLSRIIASMLSKFPFVMFMQF